MKYIKMLLKKYGENWTGLIVFTFGLFLGLVFSRVLRRFYWDEIDLLNGAYYEILINMDIDYKTLRKYVLWKDFKNFALIWGISFTKIGISSLVLILLYYGISAGFFASVMIMGYGFKGILLIIGYTFPQIIVYLAVLVLSFRGGYWLCKNLYYDGLRKRSTLEIAGKYGVFIFVLAIFLVLGALLETYVGSFVLIKIISILN